MSNNGLNNYNSLNLAFLNSVKNMHSAIFGTKNFDRLNDIEKSIQEIKPLKKDDFFKILTLQDQFKSHIGF
jgi:hypothetical protein